MEWWMVGLALSALVALATWDVGRPGHASASALLALRALGGLGLMAMAALSLSIGANGAAAVAAVASAPLLFGLMRSARPAADPAVPVPVPATTARAGEPEASDEERRAA